MSNLQPLCRLMKRGARIHLLKNIPFSLCRCENRFTTHSQFYDVAWFREIMPEPILKLNPDDAAARGISAGDTIRAYNDRGYVVLKS